ncbi:hypothetical protein GCM10009609_05540 [Pseudonocardia aurantiaca]
MPRCVGTRDVGALRSRCLLGGLLDHWCLLDRCRRGDKGRRRFGRRGCRGALGDRLRERRGLGRGRKGGSRLSRGRRRWLGPSLKTHGHGRGGDRDGPERGVGRLGAQSYEVSDGPGPTSGGRCPLLPPHHQHHDNRGREHDEDQPERTQQAEQTQIHGSPSLRLPTPPTSHGDRDHGT